MKTAMNGAFELGSRSPNFDRFAAMAKTLTTTTDFLLMGEHPGADGDAETSQLWGSQGTLLIF